MKFLFSYHFAWMFASLRKRVVAVDLDPHANLTAAFLDEDRIETQRGILNNWLEKSHAK